jgi:hypothetical protein
MMPFSWYLHRLLSMSLGETFWRLRNVVLCLLWRKRGGVNWPVPRCVAYPAPAALPTRVAEVDALVGTAEDIMAGKWLVFGSVLLQTGSVPDWHCDPLTRRRVPLSYFATIRYRDEAQVGNIKYLWEGSRLHHVTLLASAYYATGHPKYAERALRDLQDWWTSNPPLLGVNWISGIEIGIRLLAWCWCRRLLAAYPHVSDIFEGNEVFLQQLHAHQTWVDKLRSRGTSANNHAIAELAGLLAAALAFPCFPESRRWASKAASLLELEVPRQTFADGVNRELATEYHAFVLELLLFAGVEADAAGFSLSDNYWRMVRAMADALAAQVDTKLQMPRQGDGDEGRAILLDAMQPAHALLSACARLLGSASWWPIVRDDSVTALLLAQIGRDRCDLEGGRPAERPSTFPAAGISIIRARPGRPDEIWCRIDHGPHGFMSTAAHAHADALSLEVREGGYEILVDPGTYCYHGEHAWRGYFRSTIGHSTIEIDNVEQSVAAGPFLWTTHASGQLCGVREDREETSVVACHDGYTRLKGRPVHYRCVMVDQIGPRLQICDWIDTRRNHRIRMAFHLHPKVDCRLELDVAQLSWPTDEGLRCATLRLPARLIWSCHKGETDPIIGWYSPSFGRRQATTTLLGVGELGPGDTLDSKLAFHGHDLKKIHSEEKASAT